MTALTPGMYNTKSHVARDMFGNVTIEKDIAMERLLIAAGALRVNEHTWEVRAQDLTPPPPTRPAPPMPKIKPPRPDYETMLRDELIGRALTGAMSRGWRNPKDVVNEVYAVVDAVLEARNANR